MAVAARAAPGMATAKTPHHKPVFLLYQPPRGKKAKRPKALERVSIIPQEITLTEVNEGEEFFRSLSLFRQLHPWRIDFVAAPRKVKKLRKDFAKHRKGVYYGLKRSRNYWHGCREIT